MSRHVAAWLGLLALAAVGSIARGATYTWDAGAGTGNTSWSTALNWAGDALPTFAAGDTFNLSTVNIAANSTSTMDTANALGAISIGDTNNTHTWTLSLTGSLTLNGNGSAATINQVSTSKGDTISGTGGIGLASDLTLTNSANTNTLTISSPITAATAGTKTLANSGAGTGAVTVSGSLSAGSSALAIVQNSASSQLNLTNASGFGTAISLGVTSGTLNWSPGAAAGYNANGALSLGVVSGTANATLALAGRTTLSGTTNVYGSGTNTIIFGHNNSGQIHGASAVVLNNSDLTLRVTNIAGVRMQGGITGTGNIIVNNSNTTGNGVDFRTVAVNNVGEIRNISTGSVGISQGTATSFGANVTSLVQNSASAPWNLNQSNGSFNGTVQVLAGVVQLNNTASLRSVNDVFVGSAGTLDVLQSNTIAGLRDTGGSDGVVTNSSAANTALTVGGTGAYSFSGALMDGLTNTLALLKSGTGTQTLSGSSGFTGGATLSAGILAIGHEKALGVGAVTFSGNSTLQAATTGTIANAVTLNAGITGTFDSQSNSMTLGGLVSGPGSLTKIGSGAITLSNANTYTGTTTISGGTLRLSGTGTLGGSTSTLGAIAAGAVLDLNGSNQTIAGFAGSSAGAIRNNSGAGVSVLSVTGATLGSFAGTIADNDGVSTGGTVGLTVNSAGTLSLSSSNAFSGGTTITAGGITITNASALGTGSLTLNASAGNASTLTLGNAWLSISNPITVAGSGTNLVIGQWGTLGQVNGLTGGVTLANSNFIYRQTGNGGLRMATVGVTGTGNVTFENNTTNNTNPGIDIRVAINNVGTLTFSGTGSSVTTPSLISRVNATGGSIGANITSVIQDSLVTLDLNAAINAGSAATMQIRQGRAVLSNANALRAGNEVFVASGATLDAQTANTIAGLSNMSEAGGVVTSSGTVARILSLGGTGTYTFAGTLTDGTANTLGLTKSGTGTQTLSGSSSYSGATTVSAGTLRLGNANALGSTAAGTTLSGSGTLDLNGATIAEAIDVSGNGTTIQNTSASVAAVTTDMSLASNLTIDTTGDITVARLNSSDNSTTRTVSKIGAGTLTMTGTFWNLKNALVLNQGTVVLAQSSGASIDRGTTINSGTLKLSGANNNLVNDAQPFTMIGGVFDLNGKAEAVAAIVGTGGSVRNGAAATTATVYVGGGVSGASSGTFAGVFENGSGVLNLVKEGTGIQTLTGTSTYTGTTGVNAGGLIVNGALGATSTTVSAGALLGGSGSIGGLVTVSGTLSPGNSPGVIALASLALNPTATTLIEITGTNRGLAYDGIDITTNGGLTYGGTLAFDFSSLFTDNTTFDIFSFTGSSAGSFTSLVSTGSYAGTWTNNNDGTFSLAKDSQTLTFLQASGDVVIVPEPTALMLFAAGAVAWAGARRRRFTSKL